jgi:AcrR family transcriptional regulator
MDPVKARTARQQDVLAVARDLLAREGLEALTLGNVARALGIKPPSLYKHFASRRALEAELIADGLEATAAALAPATTLAQLAAAYRTFARADPELYRLMTERPLPRDLLPEGLEDQAAAPLLRVVPDPDLARAAWAAVHGLIALELAGRFPPDADLDAAWAAAVRALELAVAAGPSGRSG